MKFGKIDSIDSDDIQRDEITHRLVRLRLVIRVVA